MNVACCHVLLTFFCILDIIAWQELLFQSLVLRDIIVQNLRAQFGSPVHLAHTQTPLACPLNPSALTVQQVSIPCVFTSSTAVMFVIPRAIMITDSPMCSVPVSAINALFLQSQLQCIGIIQCV